MQEHSETYDMPPRDELDLEALATRVQEIKRYWFNVRILWLSLALVFVGLIIHEATEDSNESFETIRLIALIIFPYLLFILSIIRSVRVRNRLLSEIKIARRELSHAFPDMPESLPIKKRIRNYWLVLIVLAIVGWLVGTSISDGNTSTVLALIFLVSMSIWWKRKSSAGDRPGISRIIRYAIPLLLAEVWFYIVVIAIFTLIDSRAVAVAMIPVIFGITFHVINLLPYLWIFKRAVARGDYDQALYRVDLMRKWHPDRVVFKYFYGFVLMMAGRYGDAKTSLREMIHEWRNASPHVLSEVLSNYANVLTSQKHYEEAIRISQIAIQLFPATGSAYNVLAETYLEQGIYPERALEIVNFKLANCRLNWLDRLINSYASGSSYGLRAWALAALQRFDEADTSLKQMFMSYKGKNVYALAYFHYDAGRVKQLQGNISAAHEEFTRALELDPVGDGGQKARQALEELAA